MKRIQSIIIFVVGSVLLFGDHVLAAQGDPIGQMVWVKGDVHAVRPSQASRSLERRSGIYAEDTVITGSDASGQIIFTDQSTLSLTSGTTVAIKDYSFTRGQTTGDEREVVELVKGGFRTITGLIAKNNPQGYSVQTPVATIGVRGTDFSIFYSQQTGLNVVRNKGAITLSNNSGNVVLDEGTAKFARIVSSLSTPQVQSAALPGLQMPGLQPATLQFGPSGVLQCK